MKRKKRLLNSGGISAHFVFNFSLDPVKRNLSEVSKVKVFIINNCLINVDSVVCRFVYAMAVNWLAQLRLNVISLVSILTTQLVLPLKQLQLYRAIHIFKDCECLLVL